MNFLQRKPLQKLSSSLFLMVRSWDQAKVLLQIRNECREGMTHNTKEITLDQQKVFYDEHLHPEYGDGLYRAYLLIDYNIPVGYGGLRWDEDKYWMTIGVAQMHRGRGLSRTITELITKMATKQGKEVWLDAYTDNKAYNGYLRTGYEPKLTQKIGGRLLVTMKYEGI